MNKLTEQQIEKATNWWAGKLKSKDPGDAELDPMSTALMLMAADSHPDATDQQIDIFKRSLKDSLSGETEAVDLGVDYNPCRILSIAVASSGLKSSQPLPVKTEMFFLDGGVMVKCGYGQEFKSI